MRYMALWHPVKNAAPQGQNHYAEMGKLIGEMTKLGVLVDTGGWDTKAPAIVIKNSEGKVTVTDGPYTEAKELIAGFADLQSGVERRSGKMGQTLH